MPQTKPDPRSGSGLPLPNEGLTPCPGCQKPFQSRRTDHRFCSSKCRLIGFHQKQETQRRERDAKIRLLLIEVLGLLTPDESSHHNK